MAMPISCTETPAAAASPALELFSRCNSALLYAEDEEGLRREICRLITSGQAYHKAWLAIVVKGNDNPLHVVAESGCHEGDRIGNLRGLAGSADSVDPVSLAVRSGKAVVARSAAAGEPSPPWQQSLFRPGDGALLALPLLQADSVFAVLVIYSRQRDAFDKEETGVFSAFATNVAHVILSLRLRERRGQTDRDLQQTRQLISAVVNNGPLGILLADTDGVIFEVNEIFCRMLGYEEDELLGRPVNEFSHAENRTLNAFGLSSGESSFHNEERQYLAKDGHVVPVLLSVSQVTFSDWKCYLAMFLDLSTLRQGESALRWARDRVATILDTIPDPAWLKDRQHRFLGVNAAWCALTGMSPADALGATAEAVLPPDLADDAMEQDEEVCTRGQSTRRDELILDADGKRRWFDTVVRPLRDSQGTLIGTVGIARDITDRQTIAQALSESERKYRMLAENMGDTIWLADADSLRFVYVSPSVRRMLGYPESEMVTKGILDVVPPTSVRMCRQAIATYIQRYNAGDTSPQTAELQLVRADGSVVVAEVVSTVSRTASGALTLMGVCRDVSERVAARNILVASERRFRTIFENTTDGMLLIERETGRFHGANPHMCRLLGRAADEISGLSLSDLHPADYLPQALALFKRHADGDLASAMDVPLLRKDGGITYADSSYFTIESDGRKLLIGIFKDATERRRMDEQTRAYEARLRQLATEVSLAEERERRRLSGRLHDDVCQLLSLSLIRLSLLRQAGDAPARAQLMQEMAGLMERANASSRSLMLQLSHPALYDLGLTAGAEWLAEDIYRLYKLRVSIHDDGTPKPMDLSVRVVLYQSLRELLVNAAKHAGVAVARVSIEKNDDWVRLAVEDEGKGFDLCAAGPCGTAGGFGLFSIRERIRSMGGRVEITTSPGKGTKVVLELPSELNRDSGH
jgi:PAS domain S-box-containing protein